MFHFESSDFAFGLQCQADIVEPVDETMFAVRFHVEARSGAVGMDDRLVGQVDHQSVPRRVRDMMEDLIYCFLIQNNR